MYFYKNIALQHENENMKTCVWTNRTSLKTRGEISCSKRVCNSCVTSGTRKNWQVKKGKKTTGLWLPQI